MALPETFQANLRRLAAVARQGHAAYGRGVVVVEFGGGVPQAVHFLPEAEAYVQLREAPVLLELASGAIDRYDPDREFALLAYSQEGAEPLCWVLEWPEASDAEAS